MIHLGNLTYLIFLYTNISRETDVLGFQFCIEKLIKRKCFTAPCCRLNILHRDITLFSTRQETVQLHLWAGADGINVYTWKQNVTYTAGFPVTFRSTAIR